MAMAAPVRRNPKNGERGGGGGPGKRQSQLRTQNPAGNCSG